MKIHRAVQVHELKVPWKSHCRLNRKDPLREGNVNKIRRAISRYTRGRAKLAEEDRQKHRCQNS
jgi:hypothetical protein